MCVGGVGGGVMHALGHNLRRGGEELQESPPPGCLGRAQEPRKGTRQRECIGSALLTCCNGHTCRSSWALTALCPGALSQSHCP